MRDYLLPLVQSRFPGLVIVYLCCVGFGLLRDLIGGPKLESIGLETPEGKVCPGTKI